MQSKFEKFNELLPDLKIKTAQNLSNPDLLSLSMAAKYHLALFQSMIDVRKLLHHVVRGKHDAVQLILTDDISLIFERGKVTDCSGREFENISAFEYALWALDKHMWAAMIACVPQNEEGRKAFAQLITQYTKVNTDGVTYRLNGKTITEQHFDFENTLIKELQTQVNSINAPGIKDWDAIDKQWLEGVGSAQKLLPMHVVGEYCSNEPFYPVPKFTSQPKSSQQFYNWATKKDENWFSVDSKLAIDVAIHKGAFAWLGWHGARGAVAFDAWEIRGDCIVCDDLDAVAALCEVRTKDFINLKSQLEEQMTLNNRHQVIPM